MGCQAVALNGQVATRASVDEFFNKKDIRNESRTMSVIVTVASAQRDIEQSYVEYMPRLPADLESEILVGLASYDSPGLERLLAEKSMVDSLIAQSRAQVTESEIAAHAFFGHHALAFDMKKSAVHFVNVFQGNRRRGALEVFNAWETSVIAAYKSKILEEKIRYLTDKSVSLTHDIAVAKAEEAARLAAEAAEHVRIEAQARRVADEQALIAAQAEVQRLALQQAARQALFVSNRTLVMAANGSTLALGGQAIGQLGLSNALLAPAIERALAALAGRLLTGPGIYMAAFLSLSFYSSPTADGAHDRTPDRIRYGFGTNAEQLGLEPKMDLQDIALVQGTVDMPMRLINETRENRPVISVISTDGKAVPKSVKVRAATLNPHTGLYEVVLPSMIGNQPAITLTWTPADVPLGENPSSTTPIVSQPPPAYTGVELEPIAVDAQAYPGVLTDIDDLIVWFPAQAGIAPVYVMLSSPYEGATTRGEHSGRMYNPENAGGPTQALDWTTASITQEGIALVELHTGRFSPSDANAIMIERLKQIVRGELQVTDTDKRFYTHEIRELERYRALGVPDGVLGDVWNDAHAATLEDYKLKDVIGLLYTPEAIVADRAQTEEELNAYN